jgi:transcriptional regulator with XRE-family HTH domain
MLVNEFKAEVVRNGMTLEEVSKAIGINRSTMSRRLSDPGEFTLSEIKRIKEALKLDGKQVLEIFFSQEVS